MKSILRAKKRTLIFSVILFSTALSFSKAPKITEGKNTMAETTIKLPTENNPISALKFSADPAVLIYKDTVYIYATNDMQEFEKTKGKTNNTYSAIASLNIYSSKDLVNWTDCGSIPAAGAQGAAKWAHNSWAPAVAWKNIDGQDKFFIYFADNGSGIGVLTADSPLGPFTDPLKKQLISRQTPNCKNVYWLFDPACFIDDDGRAYLYFGGGTADDKEHPKSARCVELNADMISIKGEPQEIDAPWLFEDSGINKINGKYIYSYCSNWDDRKNAKGTENPETASIAFMTSDSPLGPFKYQGYTLRNPGHYFNTWGNNHHWIFNFKNNWYIAYHTQTLEKQLKLDGSGYRCLFIDNFSINKDGSLPIQKGTKTGVNQVCNFELGQTVSAATMHSSKNLAVTSIEEQKGLIVTPQVITAAAEKNSWLCIKNVDFSKDLKKLYLTTIGKEEGTISFRLDKISGEEIASVKIKGSKNEYKTRITKPESLKTSQTRNLYIVLEGKGLTLASWKIETN